MTPLSSIPPQLRGRGHPQCLPIKCICGEIFLWGKINTPDVQCPTCRRVETLTVDAPIANGQLK